MRDKTIELSDEAKQNLKKSLQDYHQGLYQHLHRTGGECLECGGTVDGAWNYCGWCGANLTNKEEA